MKTAGVMFDFYDDLNGSYLKESYPTPDSLPEIVKEAHILSPEERDVLRDEAFALTMVNEGKVLRKFACVDAGNTLLSALYFAQSIDFLPEEARKTAAVNLYAACEEFGLDIPFIKEAAKGGGASDEGAKGSAHGRTRNPLNQPMVGDESDWASRTNLVSVRGGADSGKVIPAAQQMKTGSMEKTSVALIDDGIGALIGHYLGKRQKRRGEKHTFGWPQGGSLVLPGGVGYQVGRYIAHNDKSIKKKHASVKEAYSNEAVDFMNRPENIELGNKHLEAFAKKLYKKPLSELNDEQWQHAYHATMAHPDMVKMTHHKAKTAAPVDVTGLEPDTQVVKMASSRMVLGRYPLDSYADVRSAVDYFKESWTNFDPVERHIYSVKTAARAEEIGIEVPEIMQRYGSLEYAPDVEAHLSNRKAVCHEQFHELYNDLKEKRASMEPEEFADVLSQVDAVAGINWYWGGEIADPWYATFGGRSEKEKTAFAWEGDGVTVDTEALQSLAGNKELMLGNFEKDLVSAFAQDPVTIFESLPDTTKQIIANLATGS